MTKDEQIKLLTLTLRDTVRELRNWHNWQTQVSEKYRGSEGHTITAAKLNEADELLKRIYKTIGDSPSPKAEEAHLRKRPAK